MPENETDQKEQYPGKERICRGPGKGTPCPACRKKDAESGTSMLRRSDGATSEEDCEH